MTNSHRTKEEIPIFFNYFASHKIVKNYFFSIFNWENEKNIAGNIDKKRFIIIILSNTTNKIMKTDFCLFSRISFFTIFKLKKTQFLRISKVNRVRLLSHLLIFKKLL